MLLLLPHSLFLLSFEGGELLKSGLHRRGKGLRFIQGGETQPIDLLLGVTPLVEVGTRLVVIETSWNGAVDDNLLQKKGLLNYVKNSTR